MEGNRHEKVAIVLCAYIIGFTTAFIGFGVNSVNHEVPDFSNTLAFVPTKSTALNEKVQEEPKIITSVSIGDDGLYAVTPLKSFILSVKKADTAASIIGSVETPGFHYAVLGAEVSPNGKFAYFCEQLSKESKTCDSYLYVVSEDMLHKVRTDSDVVKSSVEDHQSSWSEDDVLTVNGASSIDTSEPWNLAPKITTKEVDEATLLETPEDIPQVQ